MKIFTANGGVLGSEDVKSGVSYFELQLKKPF